LAERLLGRSSKDIMMMDKATLHTLRLFRSENVGPATFKTLIEIYKTPENALKNIEELSLKGGRQKPIKIASLKEVEREVEKTQKIGAEIISIFDEAYPALLKNIYDAPPVITIRGNREILQKGKIGIVGSRNASMAGLKFAEMIAKDIGKEGYATVSGLARGIDTAVHQASKNTGTIAVLAGGIDFIYPPENKKLYEELLADGLIVSEAPLGSVPKAEHFPKRNRIISGLSKAVLVVEASLNSGSLITARMANEQGRDVFAVPGSPLDARCRGTNMLIKQGAYLTEEIDDIIKNIQSQNIRKTKDYDLFEEVKEDYAQLKINDSYLNEKRQELLSLLSLTPAELKDIKKQLNIEARALQILIVELELADKIIRYPNNRFSIKL
jgi:DNA processing protein